MPSVSPSLSGVVGIINLRFSMLRPGLEALDVLLGRESALVARVRMSIRDILCWDTDFLLFQGHRIRSVCRNSTRIPQRDGEELDDKSALREDFVHITLEDARSQDFNWTRWRLTYPVLGIGEVFEDMAAENGGSALEMMESVAQLAVNLRIQDGDLDTWLDVRTSVVGLEVATWEKKVEEPLSVIYLKPAPFHGLRIAGIILFLLSLGLSSFLTNLAAKRRKEREWDMEFRERGRGGLGTEEGLDYMLEVARHESQQIQPYEDEKGSSEAGEDGDERPQIPLSGYMNVTYPSHLPLEGQ